jgi:hypothetical protein
MERHSIKKELESIIREIKDVQERKQEAESILEIATGINKINWYNELESINNELIELTYRKESVLFLGL